MTARLDYLRSGRQVLGWAVGHVRCRACGTRWVAVAAPCTDLDQLECHRCGAERGEMTPDPQAEVVPLSTIVEVTG